MKRSRPARFGFLPQVPVRHISAQQKLRLSHGAVPDDNDLAAGVEVVNIRHSSDTVVGDTMDRAKRKRRDMPVVRKVDKGDLDKAIQVCGSEGDKQAALEHLVSDMYAATSKKPRDALLNTWVKLHVTWFGREEAPVFPLDEVKLVRVSALFKCGGYKSFKNYLSRAKDQHLSLGHPWTESLNRIAQKCTRSVTRGLASARRSEAFDLCLVAKALEHRNSALADEGPASPLAMVVCATFFMLRELEVSALDRVDIWFNDGSVTLSLPVSKTDWQAKGCTRTWSCVCDRSIPCPFHVLRQHCEQLDAMQTQPDAPLFPDEFGNYCTKTGVVNTIRRAAHLAGMELQDSEGSHLLSGHTFRITGARFLSAAGLDPITIQLLGRWGSNAVLTYLAEAPLMSMNHRLKPLDNQRLDRALHQAPPAFDDLDHRVQAEKMLKDAEELQRRLNHLTGKVDELNAEVEHHSELFEGVDVILNDKSLETWKVVNMRSKVEHQAIIRLTSSPHNWKTKCGWSFAGKKYAETFNDSMQLIHTYKLCPKCHLLPDQEEQHSSSDSSSSSD